MLHDPELHDAVSKNYADCIAETRKEAAMWKEKYESWALQITDTRILNLKHGLKVDSLHMDRIAA